MRTVKITADFADMDRFDKLNTEAFPEQERVPIENFIKMAEEGLLELEAVYDADSFIGFFAVMVDVSTVYICFFAVEKSKRSMGYGGKILALLKERYKNCQIVLDLERLDENAPNNEQRKTRREFYLRNGYHPTGYCMAYFGMEFEVLCSSPNFDMDDFLRLIKKLRAKKFRPRIFHI